MTITVNKWIAVMLVALFGILAGLALGQLTRADSAQTAAQPSAQASVNLAPIVRQFHELNESIGNIRNRITLLGMLDNLTSDVGSICHELGGIGCRG